MGPTKIFRKLGPFPKAGPPAPHNITRVINGVRQVPKPIQEKVERRWFSHFFALQLTYALIERATEEDSLYESGAFPDGFADIVFEFHRSVCEAIDRTLDHSSPGAPPTLRDAKGLSVVVAQFKTHLGRFSGFDISSDTPLAICVQTLCDDVEHYIQQIRFVYAIVGLQDRRPRIANRPTNLKAKAHFVSLINHHQAIHGSGTLPKPAVIRQAMRLAGHNASPRTLRSWRQQIEEGTFGHFFQDQKRQ
jgi:hypothetical protein